MNAYNLSKLAITFLAGILLSLPGYAEEAPEENPPANQAQEESAPEASQATETEATTSPAAAADPKVEYVPDNTKEAAQVAETQERSQRDQAIFDRIKTLVKRFDAQQRKGLEFPSKMVEAAIRSEFMRRTEGGEGPAWLRKKSRDADKEVAMDNLEMLVAYAEKLGWAQAGKSKDAKEAAAANLDVKILAAKAVVDRYNVRNTPGRGLASFTGFSSPKGLTAAGKAEAARRRVLTANQVAGEDFAPITAKKYEDFAKKYRGSLVASVNEYEKLAKLVAGGSAPKEAAAPSRKTKKTKKSKKSDD